MAKEDLVQAMRAAEAKKGFVKIYDEKKSKKNEIKAASPTEWRQTLRLDPKAFKGLAAGRLGDEVEFTCRGKVTGINEDGLTLSVDAVRLED